MLAARVRLRKIAGALAATLAGAATPRRTECDIRLTDSVEREIERRLMSGFQGFGSAPFRRRARRPIVKIHLGDQS
jgi:hypothetical protein